MRISPILTAILLLSLLHTITPSKLTDTINILLPTAFHHREGHTQQIISTEGGCYEWFSTSGEVASVEGMTTTDNKCFQKALVKLIHTGVYSSSVYIEAKNLQTDDKLKVSLRVKNLTKFLSSQSTV